MNYLDQNKWIELARALYGKDNPHLLPVLILRRRPVIKPPLASEAQESECKAYASAEFCRR